MDKNYLLTYQHTKKKCGCIETTIAWFDTEDELDDFIRNNDIQVIESFKIKDVEIMNG